VVAAAQGDPAALYNLGICHAHGEGAPQDLLEAMRWLKRAAAKGHPGAAAMAAKHEDVKKRFKEEPN